MFIAGAGMAGLIAGNMLRRFDPIINEFQSELPNNHAALLRFRTDAASKVTNLPFKKVSVQKAIHMCGQNHYNPNLYFNNLYSQKVTNKVMGRSIKSLEPVERYIAPEDFISQMAKGCTINFNTPLTMEFLKDKSVDTPIISTIPMPMMMDMVGWKHKPQFDYLPIWSVVGKIKTPATDIYQTVYYPDPKDKMYRVSITGDLFIAEYIKEPDAGEIRRDAVKTLWDAFGIEGCPDDLQIKAQKFGKLMPVDETARKEFILYMTDEFGVYSLGRFATWRQLLLDDIVDDVKIIEQLVTFRGNYERKLISSGAR